MTPTTPTTTKANAAPRWLPWVLVAVAVAAIVWQHFRVGALSDEIAGLKAAPEAVAPAYKNPEALNTPHAVASLGAVERRVDVLEMRLKGLDGRVRRAERTGRRDGTLQADAGAAMALMAASDGDETPDEVAALREDVDALLTGEGLNTAEAKKALEAMMEQRDTKRRSRWIKRSDEAAQAWLDEVSTELQFDDETKTQVNEIMTARRAERRALFDKVRSDELTMVEARKTMKASREASQEALKTVLGDEAYERFNQKVEERNSLRRGGL